MLANGANCSSIGTAAGNGTQICEYTLSRQADDIELAPGAALWAIVLIGAALPTLMALCIDVVLFYVLYCYYTLFALPSSYGSGSGDGGEPGDTFALATAKCDMAMGSRELLAAQFPPDVAQQIHEAQVQHIRQSQQKVTLPAAQAANDKQQQDKAAQAGAGGKAAPTMATAAQKAAGASSEKRAGAPVAAAAGTGQSPEVASHSPPDDDDALEVAKPAATPQSPTAPVQRQQQQQRITAHRQTVSLAGGQTATTAAGGSKAPTHAQTHGTKEKTFTTPY